MILEEILGWIKQALQLLYMMEEAKLLLSFSSSERLRSLQALPRMLHV